MHLSVRSRHALALMAMLASDPRAMTPVVSLAATYQMSASAVEGLFRRLRGAGLLAAERGRRGGYRLSRPAKRISVAEIVRAAETDPSMPRRGRRGAQRTSPADNPAWDSLWGILEDQLERVSLAQIAQTPAA